MCTDRHQPAGIRVHKAKLRPRQGQNQTTLAGKLKGGHKWSVCKWLVMLMAASRVKSKPYVPGYNKVADIACSVFKSLLNGRSMVPEVLQLASVHVMVVGGVQNVLDNDGHQALISRCKGIQPPLLLLQLTASRQIAAVQKGEGPVGSGEG